MSEYLLINQAGKNCGVKALTDSMADRLEDQGWTLLPAPEAAQIKAQVAKLRG